MTTKTITGTTTAWLSKHSMVSLKDTQIGDETLAGELSYFNSDMTQYGYTKVGEARISVTLFEADAIVANKVQALKEELTTVRANAEIKCQQLQDQIQQLLAITYVEPTA